MSEVYEWAAVREEAVRLFAETPRGQLEQDVVEVFELAPALVARTVRDVAEQVAQGRVNSGWAVLRARLRDAKPAKNVVVTHDQNRDDSVDRALRRMRTDLMHVDVEAELLDELFGDRGPLRYWAQVDRDTREVSGDQELVRRIVDAWRQVRPIGEQIERDAVEWARQRVDLRNSQPASASGAVS